MKELGDLKFLAQSVILQQELIVLRLAASLCHREDAAIENRRLGTSVYAWFHLWRMYASVGAMARVL